MSTNDTSWLSIGIYLNAIASIESHFAKSEECHWQKSFAANSTLFQKIRQCFPQEVTTANNIVELLKGLNQSTQFLSHVNHARKLATGAPKYAVETANRLTFATSIFTEVYAQAKTDTDQTETAHIQFDVKTFLNNLSTINKNINSTTNKNINSTINKNNNSNPITLWLDDIDSLFQFFASSLHASVWPSEDLHFDPSLALSDNIKATCAILNALWDSTAESSESTHKVLLIQGELFGISQFIANWGGASTRYAAKILRGRSLYVSLLAECGALQLLNALNLPPSSLLMSAAGKFIVVATNNEANIQKIHETQGKLTAWSLTHTQGRINLELSFVAADQADFITAGDEGQNRILQQLLLASNCKKYQRLNLLDESTPICFSDYLERFSGVCQIDGTSLAVDTQNEVAMGRLALDQRWLGERILKNEYMYFSEAHETNSSKDNISLFGIYVDFKNYRDASNNASRIYKLPNHTNNRFKFDGAFRRFNNYVPRWPEKLDLTKYPEQVDTTEIKTGELKTFEHLACEDRILIKDEKSQTEHWVGTRQLATLKIDLDNLGNLTIEGLGTSSMTKYLSLSRTLDYFFTAITPTLCANKFKNMYTIFSGGDDMLLVGPWLETQKFACELQQEFNTYVGNNPKVTLSAGIYQHDDGLPIQHIFNGAAEALQKSKSHPYKNRITCLDKTLKWDTFVDLITTEVAYLENQNFSTGFIYELCDICANLAEKNQGNRIADMWQARLSHSIYTKFKIGLVNYQKIYNEIEYSIERKYQHNYILALNTFISKYR